MDTGGRAYLSILSWPSSFGEEDRVEALVSCAGMAPYSARQMARRALPAIVHILDAVIVDDVLGALHQAGVLALAPTREQVREYAAPESPGELQRFADEPDAFMVKQRDGGAWSFRASAVRLIAAGTVRQSGRIKIHGSGNDMRGAFMIGGAEGVVVAAALDAFNDSGGGWGGGTTRNARAIDLIDLHVETEAGTRLIRLGGPTARIGTVGVERARPSLLDQQRPIPAVLAAFPAARTANDFEGFNTPPDVEGLADASGQGKSRLNPIAYHFYSVWSALIDRGLYG